MTTNSIDEFLIQGLQEMYYTEQQLVDALGTLADQAENDEASAAFSEHRTETEEQVERLEEVFDRLGEQPEAREEKVVKALIDEHEAFAEENDGEVLERYNMSVGQKTEHHEIAAYGNLASLAEKTGHDAAADLLVESLREEQEALEEISQISERFDEQQIAAN